MVSEPNPGTLIMENLSYQRDISIRGQTYLKVSSSRWGDMECQESCIARVEIVNTG